MLNAQQIKSLSRALPFWLSLTLIPLAWIGAVNGGWTVLLLPLATWYLFSGLDAVLGLNLENADPNIGDEHLKAYALITQLWAPLQFLTLFGLIWYVPRAEHLGALESILLFFGVGVITGTVGINYSHELMHQKNRTERWLGDILLSMVLYSHFRTEHLLVHHR